MKLGNFILRIMTSKSYSKMSKYAYYYFMFATLALVAYSIFFKESYVQASEMLKGELLQYKAINLNSLGWTIVILVLGMLLSPVSVRISLITTLELSGIGLFILYPAFKNYASNALASGEAAFSVMLIGIFPLLWFFLLLFTNGFLGFVGTAAKIKDSNNAFSYFLEAISIILVSSVVSLVPAIVFSTLVCVDLLLYNTVGTLSLIAILATVFSALVLEYANHLIQNRDECTCPCPKHGSANNL